MIELIPGPNQKSLVDLHAAGRQVQAVVTDAPYGLTSITKRFGKEGAAPAQHGTDGAFARMSRGFQGSLWDGTGIERDPEFWRLIWEILVPGGYLVAFGGSRTGHRMACAIEDAGFVMHPLKGWLYSQGMPKASNAQRAIDCYLCDLPGRHYESALPREKCRPDDHVCPTTEDGLAWEGWAYGTQADKPALEPIFVGQKPFAEKNGALNLLRHGAGAINIDGCRVSPTGGDSLGRFPANFCHDGSPEVLSIFPNAPGQLARSSSSETRKTQNIYGTMLRGAPGTEMEPRGDSGSAARFFNCFPPDGEPVLYQAKANKADRAQSLHPSVKPIALMQWLCRMVTPPGGTILDPFAGSGTTGEAARREGFDCILMEAEPQFVADIRRRFDIPDPHALPPELAALLGDGPADDLIDLLG